MTFYNPVTRKGSFVRVWIQDKKVDLYKDVMTEPISLFAADDNPWW